MSGVVMIFHIALLLAGLCAFAMASYFFIVTMRGFFAGLSVKSAAVESRIAVIIPAHNEALLIERTINSVKSSDYPVPLFDIIVIADNCTDDTAGIARDAGVTCLQRSDTGNKGKGYALQWAFENEIVKNGGYGAFLIMDADSVVSKNVIQKVNDYISSGFDALTCYHMVQGRESTPVLEMVKMGFILRNLRNAGISALGGSAPLLGSGMGFSRKLVESFGWTSFSLTEDREEWAFLYSKGVRVGYIPEARVFSEIPETVKDLGNPRARWDIGRKNIKKTFLMPFLSRLMAEKNLGSLVTFFELIAPPFTLFLFFIGLVTLPLLLAHNHISPYTTALWLAALSLMILSALAGLIRMKAAPRSYLNLFVYSFFLIPWRVFNFLRGTLGKREWRRTARGDSTKEERK
ncbi:MAG: glycosyltransferase family 2 protein [Thermodesulfobacteriota bacterium]